MMQPIPIPEDVKSIIQIHSGGFDSTTLLYWIVKNHPDVEVRTLTIDYGQRIKQEIKCAQRISDLLKVEHRIADLSNLRQFFGESTLLTGAQKAPSGNQWDKSMMANMVPNRNMLMLSVAAAWAFSSKADAITYGCHEENYALDSQLPFIDKMQEVLHVADWHKVKLITPLMGLSKAELVQIGLELDIPYQHTYSCYRGTEKACGVCGACVRRLEAFWLCGEEDPAAYEDLEHWKKLSQRHPESVHAVTDCKFCHGLGYDITTQVKCTECL